jgi:YjbE family integral membrane protein
VIMSPAQVVLGALSIVLIDLMLAGDNALVIAMAVRSLPPRQRRLATFFGAGAAVALRIALTAIASQLLGIPYVQLIGGVLILWIALRVLIDVSEEPVDAKAAGHTLQAVWYIVVADITMSTDNVLAVAAASKGHLGLMVFGLALSIPLVVFASTMLSKLMDRYPVLIYVGSAILGRVGGEMLLTDPVVGRLLHPAKWMHWGAQAFFALAVVIVGRAIAVARRRKRDARS